jgi:arylsulfatase A-like enzyme
MFPTGSLPDSPRRCITSSCYLIQQTNTLALSIRRGRWKYLDHKGSGGNNYKSEALKPFALPDTEPDAPGQLYDLEADPGETKNVYFEHPEIVAELKRQLDAYVKQGYSRPRKGGKK